MEYEFGSQPNLPTFGQYKLAITLIFNKLQVYDRGTSAFSNAFFYKDFNINTVNELAPPHTIKLSISNLTHT